MQTIGQELRLSRRRAIFYNILEILALGILTILGYSLLAGVHPLAFLERYRSMDILDTLDFVSNNVIMPLGAIFTTILVVAVIGLERFCQEVTDGGKIRWPRQWLFQFCVCVIVIPCLLVVFLNAIGMLH